MWTLCLAQWMEEPLTHREQCRCSLCARGHRHFWGDSAEQRQGPVCPFYTPPPSPPISFPVPPRLRAAPGGSRQGAPAARSGPVLLSGSAPWRAGPLTAVLASQVAPGGTRWSRNGGTRSGTWRPTKTPSCRWTSGASTRATCSSSCAAPGPPWASGRLRTAWLASLRGLCTGKAYHPWPSWGPPVTNPWRGGSQKGNPSPSPEGPKG